MWKPYLSGIRNKLIVSRLSQLEQKPPICIRLQVRMGKETGDCGRTWLMRRGLVREVLANVDPPPLPKAPHISKFNMHN